MDKKELKRKYKDMVHPMGLFVIRNQKNGRIFIGSGLDLNACMNSNRFQLKNGLHGNRELQREFTESAGEGFSFEILDSISPRDGETEVSQTELKALESLWLEKLQPYDGKGYHKRPA